MLRKRELVEEEVLIKKAKPVMEKYKVTYGSFVSVDDQMGGSKRYGISAYFINYCNVILAHLPCHWS